MIAFSVSLIVILGFVLSFVFLKVVPVSIAAIKKDESIWSKASELMAIGKVSSRVEEIRKPIVEKAQLTLEQRLKDLLRLREKAVKDSKWSAAVVAEMGCGKAAGLYVNKVDSDDDKNLTI